MLEKSMHDELDFGAEAVKGVDAKLAILKFNYSWAAEVEKGERIMEEVKRQPLEPSDAMKQKQWKSEEDNKTVVHRQPILDFGEEPVKNLDAKLEILKFNYSWVDEVEREERMTEEAKWKALEPTDVMKQKQWPSDDNNRSIYGQAFLDFGEEPVTNLDVKLDILKFNYSWATEVEEHERRTKEAQLQSKDQEDATEKEIQKSVPIEEVKVKIPEKPQKVTPEDQAREMTKVQNAKEEVQEKTNNGLSKPTEIFNDEKPETGLKTEVYQHGQKISNIQPLTNIEVKNEDHFIPRRLFLFGITEFKTDAAHTNIYTEISMPNVCNSLDELSTICISEATMATVSPKKSLRRRIKNFLGFK